MDPDFLCYCCSHVFLLNKDVGAGIRLRGTHLPLDLSPFTDGHGVYFISYHRIPVQQKRQGKSLKGLEVQLDKGVLWIHITICNIQYVIN